MEFKDTENVVIAGVWKPDYPDFVDAYFEGGYIKATGEPLTDEQLAELTDKYPEVVNQMACESLYGNY